MAEYIKGISHEKLIKKPTLGIKSLIDAASNPQNPTSDNIRFFIGKISHKDIREMFTYHDLRK